MIRPQHIFCEPAFTVLVSESFPDIPIQAFSLDVNSVQDDIAKLDLVEGDTAWLLLSPAESGHENAPVKDHMNLCRENPLIGPARGSGPRFPDMSSVYTDSDGVIAVLGEDEDLVNFKEPWVGVCGGIWEAIVLRQQGINCKAWVVSDLEKWVKELPAFD
ncbi:MAG: hypothetical protein K9M49_04635 [Candidatus Marinimicrobia bacterium]|nr:hypothetical protein [Candidatus Neomarinimicrobiota bacterium]MCF7904424.1 hypothetical protein [Candidatus Neomarinimicrobiota bacterium]